MEVEDLYKADYEDSNSTTQDESIEAPNQETEVEKQAEEEMRLCKHCNFQAEDWPAFAMHVLKPSHVKKVAETMKVRVPLDPALNNLYCDMCEVNCAGHVPWNAHLMGAKHRKAKELLARQKIVQQSSSFMQNNYSGSPMRNNQFGNTHNTKPYDRPKNTFEQPGNASTTVGLTQSPDEYDFTTYPKPLIGLEFISETDEPTGKIKRYYCSLCHCKFDHNLRFAHPLGQKHRLHVMKIKRSAAVKNVNSANMKGSEISALLELEAAKLEQEEGRHQPQLKIPANNTPLNARGRGVNRGDRGVQLSKTWNNRGSIGITRGSKGISRGTRGNSGYTPRGTSRGNRGTRGNTRGHNRGGAVGQHSSGDYYNSYGNESFGANLSFNSAYNANFDNPDYGDYQQSYGSGQSYSDMSAQDHHETGGQSYDRPAQQTQYHDTQNRPTNESNTQRPKSKTGISSNLMAALGDLEKLVENDEDASVALHVSNALTQALFKYRIAGQE